MSNKGSKSLKKPMKKTVKKSVSKPIASAASNNDDVEVTEKVVYNIIDQNKPFPLKLGDKDLRKKGESLVKELQSFLGVKADGYLGEKTMEKVISTFHTDFVSEEVFYSKIKKPDPLAKRMYLVIHCTGTPEGREVTPEDIERWHLGMKKNNDGTYTFMGKIYSALHHLPVINIGGIPVQRTNGRGWSRGGYSVMFPLNDEPITLIPDNGDDFVDRWELSNGAKGFNLLSKHIVYVGGKTHDMKFDKDTRTERQKEDMKAYVLNYIKEHPDIIVVGHGSLPNANKSCPNFDVSEWLREIGVQDKNIYKHK